MLLKQTYSLQPVSMLMIKHNGSKRWGSGSGQGSLQLPRAHRWRDGIAEKQTVSKTNMQGWKK